MRQAAEASEDGPRPPLRAIPPGLHFVSTPIGSARDITLRALDVLSFADVLVAEDTRTLRRLMEIHGIPLGGRRIMAYHDHSKSGALQGLVNLIAEGKSLAYASEAGTPLISDPGFELARAVAAAGLPLSAAPGPCAAICALTVSGLPTDRFFFAGFPPTGGSARSAFISGLAEIQATLIFYESPKRLAAFLADLARVLGRERRAVVCRELTKRFEEVSRADLGRLAEDFATREVKGEIVVLVDRAAASMPNEDVIATALLSALRTMSVKDAASFVSQTLGVPRKIVYRMALERAHEEEGPDAV